MTERFSYWGVLAVIAGCVFSSGATAQDELAGRASWSAPDAASIRDRVATWLKERDFPATTQADALDELMSDERQLAEQPLRQLIGALAVADSSVAEVYAVCSRPRTGYLLPEFPLLHDEQVAPLVRYNLRLYVGRWLADQRLYDEAHTLLHDLQTNDVVDPATLLFYQSIVHYRLLQKDESLSAIQKLQENTVDVPRRYSTVARLLQADLAPLREGSLDEVARMMANIKDRLAHGRAGKRVRTEEDDVIAKLDKMIEDLEQQAGQQGSGSSSGSNNPSSPMQDSVLPGGPSTPGDVDRRSTGSNTEWGNLPPKEREEALQQLSKDLPAHFRDVIVEYFRKLARDGVEE